MIDQLKFAEAMGAIARRCAIEPDADTLALYYRFLSPRLTTAEFSEACRSVYATATFFPPPMAFMEARSNAEWLKLQVVLDSYTPPHVGKGFYDAYENLSHESLEAIKAMGGLLEVKTNRYDRDIGRCRGEFLKSFTVAAASDAPELVATEEPKLIEPADSDPNEHGVDLGDEVVA